MWWRNARGAAAGISPPAIGRRRQKKIATAALIERCEPRYLLSGVTAPSNIPTTVFNILSYGAGASATNSQTNTAAINAAIAAASANVVNGVHGGVVEIPAAATPWLAGPYLKGSSTITITLASNVDLQIDAGATLQAVPEASYLGAGSTSVANFVSASNLTNFEITGSGVIDGNGSGWWAAYNANNSVGRPRLVEISGCNIFLMQGVTLQNAGEFNLAFGNTNNVTVNGIKVSDPSSSPNTDGIDPAGSNYLIENCNISDGDDDIAVKPQSVACSNITIENCTIGTGHGISVGGETNDGLNGLYVNNVTFNGTTNGIRLKADRTNGGVVQNVYYSNITMTNVEFPILIDSYYNGGNNLPSNPSSDAGSTYIAGSTPLWENIVFANFTSTDSASNSVAGVIYGLPEAPVANVDFVNVKITAKTGLQINHARNVRFDSNSSITVSSGNDLYGSTSGTPTFPNPYDATIVGAGFSDLDIGSPTVAVGTSSALFNPDTAQWTLMGDGAGIAGTSDQLNAAFGAVIGDSNVQAQLKSLSTPGGAAVSEAGVMYCNSSAAGDAFVGVVQTSASQIVFEYRTASGGTVTTGATVSAAVGSDYLRISRSGSTFTGYYSTDGSNWTSLGSVSISAIATTAQAGLVASSGSNGSLATAVFANVSPMTGPSIATAAAANPTTVTGTTTALSVLGSEGGSDTGFIYIWQAGSPGSSSILYSAEETNTAKNSTANFAKAGSYAFSALIIDPLGLSVTSTAPTVTVNQTLTSISVTPKTATINEDSNQSFFAQALDQFGNAMSSQPVFAWSIASGIGSINSTSGIYTSPAAAGIATVEAAANGGDGTATVTIVNATPTVATAAAANPSPVTGTSTTLSVLGADDGGQGNLTYSWSSTGPSGVTYSGNANGTNAAQNITANFTQAGSYSFTATITDSGGLFTTSSVNVTVNQTATAVSVSPNDSPVVPVGLSQQFSAAVTDQFGNAMASPSLSWSISGSGNSINNTGEATLGSTPGSFTVTATDGSAQGSAGVIAENFAVPSGSTLNVNLGTAGAVSLVASGNNLTASQNGVQISFTGMTSITVTDTGSGDVLNTSGSIAIPLTLVNCGTSTINVNSGSIVFASASGGSISLGTLSIATGASAMISAATINAPTILSLNALSIADSGSLDVTNNEVLIQYGDNADPISTIRGWITSGYAGGAWNGSGIFSSIAQSNPSYGLGYADAADANNPAGLTSGQIEILYTLLGDANLDGKVNGIDFTLLSANFNQSATAWDQGDFNYDNKANGIDFTLLSENFNQGSQIAVAAAEIVPVSEMIVQTTTVPATTTVVSKVLASSSGTNPASGSANTHSSSKPTSKAKGHAKTDLQQGHKH